MKLDEKTGKFFVYIAVIAIAFFIVSKFFGGIDGLLEKLGLKDSAEKKKNNDTIDAANSTSADSPFNPNLYKNSPSGTHIFTSATANALAKQIWESNGYIYDTPEQAEAAFKQCPTKVKVSQVCDALNTLYQVDAFEWMHRTFDTSSQVAILASIVKYCNGLPKY